VAGVECPAHCSVVASGSGQTRTVELLGLNTGDPGLYTAAAWGGAGAVGSGRYCSPRHRMPLKS